MSLTDKWILAYIDKYHQTMSRGNKRDSRVDKTKRQQVTHISWWDISKPKETRIKGVNH